MLHDDDMDVLVIGNFWLMKSEQPIPLDPLERQRFLQQFKLD